MMLLRWRPLGELDSVERQLRRLLSDTGMVPAPLPAADVYETEGEFVIELEVPGFAEAELVVETTDRTVCVKGTRETTEERKEATFQLHERLAASFERRFVLPPEVDVANVEASFDKGVLKVTAPKLETVQARKVPIGAAS
jgi:HSP20 family protein